LLRKALGWIGSNLHRLDSILDRNDYEFYLKVTGELILLCGLYHRRFGQLNKQLTECIAYARRLLNELDYEDQILRKPAQFLPYSVMYASLRDCGLDDEKLGSAVKKAIDRNYLSAMDLKAFQKMDLRYSLNRWNFEHGMPTLQELSISTPISSSCNPVYFQLKDLYSLTHSVFYLSDFGFDTVKSLTEEQTSTLLWTISALLGIRMTSKDLDLSSEFLLCCQCLKKFPDPVFWLAWNQLLSGQEIDGSIRGPLFDEKKFQEIGPDHRGKYYFEENYHTTFVAAIVSFLTDFRSFQSFHEPLAPFESRIKSSNLLNTVGLANRWLNAVPESHFTKASDFLYLLLGRWLSYSIGVDNDLYSLLSVGKRIRDRIEQIFQIEDNGNNQTDVALCLLGLGIFNKLKLTSSALEGLAHEYDKVIKNLKIDSSEQGLNLYTMTSLFKQLGVQYPDFSIDFSYSMDLSKREDDVERLYKTVLGLTEYGIKKNQGEYSDILFEVEPALRAYFLYSLSKYDMQRGLELCRAMNYMSMNDEVTFNKGVEFLLEQQRSDGRFGYYDAEASTLARNDPRFNATTELYLPLTVSAMWTFGELGSKDFSLVKSIGINRYC
jgi:hypothetical protein